MGQHQRLCVDGVDVDGGQFGNPNPSSLMAVGNDTCEPPNCPPHHTSVFHRSGPGSSSLPRLTNRCTCYWPPSKIPEVRNKHEGMEGEPQRIPVKVGVPTPVHW